MAQSASPDHCAEQLAALLLSQAEVCGLILEKSKLQQSMVEDQREDELLVLLADKQKLIDRQQALAARAAPFRQQWEAGVVK